LSVGFKGKKTSEGYLGGPFEIDYEIKEIFDEDSNFHFKRKSK